MRCFEDLESDFEAEIGDFGRAPWKLEEVPAEEGAEVVAMLAEQQSLRRVSIGVRLKLERSKNGSLPVSLVLEFGSLLREFGFLRASMDDRISDLAR